MNLSAQHLPAKLIQIEGNYFSGIGSSKSHPTLLACVIHECSDEETLTCEYALEPGEQVATHTGLHLDTGFHISHRSDFRAHTLAKIQLDFHKLQIIPKNLIINHIGHVFFYFRIFYNSLTN
jgi:hypothetical protein